MSEFHFEDSQRRPELEMVQQRELTQERLFVLLLGPSATGKSTIISEMNAQTEDSHFEYVKPIITRPNRPGETDKISVSEAEFTAIEERGDFVVVNALYGVRYGTPLQGILEPLRRGKTPILDYPLETVHLLQRPEYDTLNFYIYPPSVGQWRERIESSGRNNEGRLESGLRELGNLALNDFTHPDIDISIVNAQGQAEIAARDILEVIREAVR